MDECLEEDVCLLPNEQCKNLPGNFTCSCKEEFERSDPHKPCESIAFNNIKNEVREDGGGRGDERREEGK